VNEAKEGSWLLLMPTIPSKPGYLRVKVWRRLQTLGAVAIKNSVYVLPNTDEAREDFEWMRREILKDGGEATLCEARMIEGLRDEEVQATFHAARDADYAEIAEAARTLARQLPRGVIADDRRAQLEVEIARLRRRFTDVSAIDFFGAPRREGTEGLVSGLESRLRPASEAKTSARGESRQDLRGRVWVTRKGVHVDRIASAWLIRRFIDPEARLKFVPAKGYVSEAGELRFDMFEAEFTHEGDRCSFEVLVQRFGLKDPALGPIAEIVHDIDLKDSKFERPDAEGVARIIAGLALAHRDDEARLRYGAQLFEHLYHYFRRFASGDVPLARRKQE